MPELRSPMSEEPLHCSGGPVSGPPPAGGWSPQLALLAESPPPPPPTLPAAEGPLDLTTRPAGPPADPLVMDLSLPDKDALVEACYTCGTLVRRSTLHALLVLRRHRYGDEPFFPSLVEHGRPAGSRPMTPDGRVNVCACCVQRLVGQWDAYQKENKVVPDRRSYAVCAAGGPPLGEFVCYMCCLTYSVACRSRLRVAPGPAGEPCHPDVLRPATPPGAEGVHAGTVSVCVNCRRKAELRRTLRQGRPLPADSHCYRIIEEAVREAHRRPSPTAAAPAAEPAASTFDSIRVRRREVVCLSCRGTHQRDFMAEVRFHSADPARMHFPSLALVRRPPGAAVGCSSALVCVQCYRALRKQWQAYEASAAPAADRTYATRRGSCGSGSDSARESPPASSQSPPASSHSPPASSQSPPSRSPPAQARSPRAASASPPAVSASPPAAPASPLAASASPPVDAPSASASASPPAPSESSAAAPRSPKRPSSDAPARSAKRCRTTARDSPATSPKPMSLVAPSTVTAGCYACHQPLEANRAYEVRTEPDPADGTAPFFPHLAQQRHLPAPVCSVAVCVFCYHTLADQWARYERLSRKIDPYRREYDTHNFICFVCSVRTYRKRLHVIDVKDFPFLTASHRYPEGALLICNRTKSVVCRDCHGTLNCQFQDYERWNLPVSKREYNWVARPPPPESPEPRGRPDTVIVRYVAAKATGLTETALSL